MTLELHVWGPAFGLPSIDPQCLATIAYFVFAIPEKDAEWELIADSDPLVAPTHELPALRVGARWVSGFRNIVDFLKQYSNGQWDLDHWLDKKAKADCRAFSSFIETHGQSLVDLSLYVSSENYTTVTRPVYGSLLSWPNQWIIPPKIRDLARTRTDHLGLASLDVDATEEERQRTRETDNVAAAQIPKSLVRQPRDTVSSLLDKTSLQNQIRLKGMTEAFATPLEELRNRKQCLLSDDLVSSVDCLALGYLSLAVVPDLPHAWLRDGLQSQAAGLVEYTERLRRQCFGESVDAAMALSSPPTRDERATVPSGSRQQPLPWQPPEQVTVGGMGLRVWNAMMDSIPAIRDVRASRRLQQVGREMAGDEEQDIVTAVARARRNNTYLSVAAVASGLGLLAWSMISSGWITVVSSEDQEQQHEEEAEEWQEGLGGNGPPGGPSSWGQAGSVLGI